MVSAAISRSIIIVFGLLYPAYCSYKAIKTRNVSQYVKWMMYWIVFALFYNVETVADLLISWFPMYYEMKAIFVIWLLSPATKGSEVLYKMYIHPRLLKHEQEIEKTLERMKSQSYTTLINVSAQGVNLALQGAIVGQTKLADQIRKSYSFDDTDSSYQRQQEQLKISADIEDDLHAYEEYNTLNNRFQRSAMNNREHDREIHQSQQLRRRHTSQTLHERTSPQTVHKRSARPVSASYLDRGSSHVYDRHSCAQHQMPRSLDKENSCLSVADTSKRVTLRSSQSTPGLSQVSKRSGRLPQQTQATSSTADKKMPTIVRPVTRKPNASTSAAAKQSTNGDAQSAKAAVTVTKSAAKPAEAPKKPRFTESTLRYRTKKISDIKSHKIESPFVSIF